MVASLWYEPILLIHLHHLFTQVKLIFLIHFVFFQQLTENAFIYAFALVYNPEVFGRSGITRSQSAVIRLECHYQR